jgi:SAM-dependent methyltransferase
VLDVACGGGRHLGLARMLGHSVVGIDRDLAGLKDLAGAPEIELIETDLESGEGLRLGGRTFDGVIVTNYLWRPILDEIVAAVAGAGILVYETFGAGNERFGRPANPDHLLRAGELVEAVHGRLTTIAYEHVTLADPDRVVSRIAAVGPEHSWLRQPPAL